MAAIPPTIDELKEQLIRTQMVVQMYRSSDRNRLYPRPIAGMTHYKFRAECAWDIAVWSRHVEVLDDDQEDEGERDEGEKESVTITNLIAIAGFLSPQPGKPPRHILDTDAEFYSAASLEELRDSMRRMLDSHVMYQTLNTAAAYTGERNMDL